MNFLKTFESWSGPFKFPKIIDFLKDITTGKINFLNLQELPLFDRNDLENSIEEYISPLFDSGHKYYDVSYCVLKDGRSKFYTIIFEDDEITSVIPSNHDDIGGSFVFGDLLVFYGKGLGYYGNPPSPPFAVNLTIYNISTNKANLFPIQIHFKNSEDTPPRMVTHVQCVSVEGGEYEFGFDVETHSIIARERSSRTESRFVIRRNDGGSGRFSGWKDVYLTPNLPTSTKILTPDQLDEWDTSSKPLSDRGQIGDVEDIQVICNDCEGEGEYTCSECDGESSWECDSCDGSGECSECDGTGEVSCETCGGESKVECDYCQGSGTVNEDTCHRCSGSGDMDCADCEGEGKIQCYECYGNGSCGHCEEGYHICDYCDGGTQFCGRCDGEGGEPLIQPDLPF